MRKYPNPPPPDGSRPPAPPDPPEVRPGVRADGRAPRAFPLQAPTVTMVKLGSIAVHAEEFLSPTGHGFDKIALQQLLDDPDVKDWLFAMDKLALLPRKR